MRRRHDDTRISLFSFQDIITSLAGIMIFVALMMVLDISDAGAARATSPGRPSAAEADQAIAQQATTLRALQSEEQALSSQTSQLAGRDTGSLQRDIEALQYQLTALRSRHAGKTNQNAQLVTQVADASAADEAAVRQIAQLAHAKARIDAAPKRVVYTLKQDGPVRDAVIIEVSRESVLVRGINSAAPPTRITARNQDARWSALRAALAPFPPASFDVLVLLKPSAFAGGDFRERLAILGYRVGTEPLEENRSTMSDGLPEPADSSDPPGRELP